MKFHSLLKKHFSSGTIISGTSILLPMEFTTYITTAYDKEQNWLWIFTDYKSPFFEKFRKANTELLKNFLDKLLTKKNKDFAEMIYKTSTPGNVDYGLFAIPRAMCFRFNKLQNNLQALKEHTKTFIVANTVEDVFFSYNYEKIEFGCESVNSETSRRFRPEIIQKVKDYVIKTLGINIEEIEDYRLEDTISIAAFSNDFYFTDN